MWSNILAERTLSKVKLLRVGMQMNLKEITNFSQVKRIEVEDADEERNNGSLLSVRCKLSSLQAPAAAQFHLI